MTVQVARVDDIRNAYKTLVEKPDWKRQLRRARHGGETIKNLPLGCLKVEVWCSTE
jgi:hypothetical protein